VRTADTKSINLLVYDIYLVCFKKHGIQKPYNIKINKVTIYKQRITTEFFFKITFSTAFWKTFLKCFFSNINVRTALQKNTCYMKLKYATLGPLYGFIFYMDYFLYG